MITYYLIDNGIVKLQVNEDGSQSHHVLTQDPANTDYQQYLAWLAEGHEPIPADQPE